MFPRAARSQPRAVESVFPQLPQRDEERLSERLAARTGISENRILLGYGSEDLLKQTVHCHLDAGDTLLIPDHSWWYYNAVASEVNGIPIPYPLSVTPATVMSMIRLQ